MPNGESREGLEDVLEREGQYLTSASRRQSVEEMIAEMRSSILSRNSMPDPRMPIFRDPQTPEPRLKIPKGYKSWRPIVYSETQLNDYPEGIEEHTRVRAIFRNGTRVGEKARYLWWGDSPESDTAIVAYKPIKVEQGWVAWGNLYSRSELEDRPLDDQVPEIVTANPEARVFVWLRDAPRPNPAQNVRNWYWGLDGTGNDILRYRLAGRNE